MATVIWCCLQGKKERKEKSESESNVDEKVLADRNTHVMVGIMEGCTCFVALWANIFPGLTPLALHPESSWWKKCSIEDKEKNKKAQKGDVLQILAIHFITFYKSALDGINSARERSRWHGLSCRTQQVQPSNKLRFEIPAVPRAGEREQGEKMTLRVHAHIRATGMPTQRFRIFEWELEWAVASNCLSWMVIYLALHCLVSHLFFSLFIVPDLHNPSLYHHVYTDRVAPSCQSTMVK